MQNTSAVRHHHTSALRWGSQALHCSQGHLSLSGRLHPRQSTFSPTKPALVLRLLRLLFLINSVYFSKRGQGGTCSGMQSDCVPYADTNHIFLHISIHVSIYKPELYICKIWCVYIHISLYVSYTNSLHPKASCVCTHKHALNHLLPAPRAIHPCVQPERRKHHRWLRPQHVPAVQLLPLN